MWLPVFSPAKGDRILGLSRLIEQICFYLTGHSEVQHVSSGHCQNQTEALQALLFAWCSAGSIK